jgi:hypothetical protein
VTVRFGVSYGAVPYSVALYTCRCGAQVLQPDVAQGTPGAWVDEGEDIHVCPRCAARRAARNEPENRLG